MIEAEGYLTIGIMPKAHAKTVAQSKRCNHKRRTITSNESAIGRSVDVSRQSLGNLIASPRNAVANVATPVRMAGASALLAPCLHVAARRREAKWRRGCIRAGAGRGSIARSKN